MADTQQDFVQVRLTDAGRDLARGGTLRISNGYREFTLTGTDPVKVERSYEWRAFLRNHTHSDGSALVELVPSPQVPQPVIAAGNAHTEVEE